MGLIRYDLSSGRTHEYGQSKVLALYTGQHEQTGTEPGAALADTYADPARNPWLPEGGDPPVLVWFPGESVLFGQPLVLRRLAYEAPAQHYVTTVMPMGDDLELVCREPRLIHAGGEAEHLPGLCFASSARLPERGVAHLKQVNALWARMRLACDLARRDPKRAAAQFATLAAQAKDAPWAGLATRNQVCALIAAGKHDQAMKVLDGARKRFPGYTDLDCLLGWWLIRHRALDAADTLLNISALPETDPQYFYASPQPAARLSWLRARLARAVGNDQMAVQRLAEAMWHEPFRSSYLNELSSLGPTAPMLRRLYPLLRSVVWRSPAQVPAVTALLTSAGLTGMAEELLAALPLSDAERHALLSGSLRPERPALVDVEMEGEFLDFHSLSRVNHSLARGLLAESIDLSLVPTALATRAEAGMPGLTDLARVLTRSAGHPRVTVRHLWPPDLSRPASGRLVVYLGGESGSLRKEWYRHLDAVDEIWVYSHYVRDFMIRDGVDPDKVAVVPCGVDTTVFSPQGERKQFEGCRGFTFLFVGGLIPRKGMDLLLEAYGREFSADEDVTLVIKGFGQGAVYNYPPYLRQLRAFARRPDAPHIVVSHQTVSDADLAALYRGCGALVHPYRAEGFGLPVAEAMACGAPVIVTGGGACLDFCHEGVAYIVPAREVSVPEEIVERGVGPTVRRPTWHEVSVDDLRKAMRHVFTHRAEARERGQAAAAWIASRFTWERSAAIAADRLRRLLA